MDAITHPPLPINEPIREYSPGSVHREKLTAALTTMSAEQPELPMHIGGRHRLAAGAQFEVDGERVGEASAPPFRVRIGARAGDHTVVARPRDTRVAVRVGTTVSTPPRAWRSPFR